MEKSKKEIIKLVADELISKGNISILDEAFATDYIAYAGEKVYRGHAFLKKFAKQLRTAIPNLQVIEVKFLSQDADTVVWLRTLRGKHAANLQGIPASGKEVTWNEMVVSRFEGGKIAAEWVVSELAGELLLNAPRKE